MEGLNISELMLNFLPYLLLKLPILALAIYVIILFTRLVNAVEKMANRPSNNSDIDTNQLRQ